ncbi:MAG: endonuclease domain-containing protein [Bacteroidetes bacterium]|nr:endonuclease domain-containing protein [Bacteroidota bacterium]
MSGTEMHYGASPKLFKYAVDMRKNPTATEKITWDLIKVPPFAQFRFRRQHPIGAFIADFYSHSLKAVIEIDGGYHLDKEQRALDGFRDSDMEGYGIRVLRLKNQEVEGDLERVRERIMSFVDGIVKQSPSIHPASRQAGSLKGDFDCREATCILY